MCTRFSLEMGSLRGLFEEAYWAPETLNVGGAPPSSPKTAGKAKPFLWGDGAAGVALIAGSVPAVARGLRGCTYKWAKIGPGSCRSCQVSNLGFTTRIIPQDTALRSACPSPRLCAALYPPRHSFGRQDYKVGFVELQVHPVQENSVGTCIGKWTKAAW